jgi:hypothetical protein
MTRRAWHGEDADYWYDVFTAKPSLLKRAAWVVGLVLVGLLFWFLT